MLKILKSKSLSLQRSSSKLWWKPHLLLKKQCIQMKIVRPQLNLRAYKHRKIRFNCESNLLKKAIIRLVATKRKEKNSSLIKKIQ